MSELVLHTHLNSEAAKRDAGKWRGVVVGEIKLRETYPNRIAGAASSNRFRP